MKKTYQWKWNGKFIPIQKLHSNQLSSILKSLDKSVVRQSSSISKKEWKLAITEELSFRDKRDTNQVIKMIQRNHIRRAKNTVNGLIKQFSNSKIF